jgi:hypothetical protein
MLLGIVMISLTASLPAAATTFNTGDIEAHCDWHSLTLSLGEERHFRAMEGSSYSDAIFSLNATARACDLPWLELRVELEAYQDESRTVNVVPADLRVDEQTIHSGEAKFITHRGDDGFYVTFHLQEQDLLLEEMQDGDVLRLRMMRDEDDPWFMTFSLAGADDAIARMRRQCKPAAP